MELYFHFHCVYMRWKWFLSRSMYWINCTILCRSVLSKRNTSCFFSSTLATSNYLLLQTVIWCFNNQLSCQIYATFSKVQTKPFILFYFTMYSLFSISSARNNKISQLRIHVDHVQPRAKKKGDFNCRIHRWPQLLWRTLKTDKYPINATLQAVLVAADCNPKWLTKHIPTLAFTRQVPVLCMKDNKGGSVRLGHVVNVRTALAIGVKVGLLSFLMDSGKPLSV